MRCCSACGAVYRAEIARCVSDGTALTERDDDPLVGKRIGSYKVDEFLGQGGMGRVYRAHHLLLTHKLCALKVLIGDYAATPAMRIRFAKEAENASRLSHPNIAAVSDFGRTDSGLLFLAMELVEGRSLDRLITNEPMAPARLIRLARQLCAGLAHAHGLGLIHRDFKPENILVLDTPDGELPKIVDFGLAIANDHTDARVTSTGMVMGTPAYVAPEQCTNTEVDHRVDLYSLGVTMFEALSGGFLPFDGGPAEIVGLKVATRAPTLAERAPHANVPPGLATLVAALLARRPEDRPADANAVIAALDALERAPGAVPELAHRRKRKDDTIVEIDHQRTPPVLQTGRRTQIARAPDRRLAVVIGAGAIAIAIAITFAAVLWSQRQVVVASAGEPPRDVMRPVGDVHAAEQPAPAPPGPPPVAIARSKEEPPPRPRVATPPPRPTPVVPARRTRQGSRTAARVAALPKPAPVIAQLAAPPPALPPAPPAPPPVLVVSIDGLDVDGALPSATVRRALERLLPAIRACRRDIPGVVDVRFSIGESRRATGTSARGVSPGVAGCVASAIGGLRTEVAPDVGDVEVRLRIAFARRI